MEEIIRFIYLVILTEALQIEPRTSCILSMCFTAELFYFPHGKTVVSFEAHLQDLEKRVWVKCILFAIPRLMTPFSLVGCGSGEGDRFLPSSFGLGI